MSRSSENPLDLIRDSDFADLRSNISNIDPAWQADIKALLREYDLLLQTLQVEMGLVKTAPFGWEWLEQSERWIYAAHTGPGEPHVVVREAAGVWCLQRDGADEAAGVHLLFSTALEAMNARPISATAPSGA